MDFFDVQLDDMTLVKKVKQVYEFPAVNFNKRHNVFIAYFNKHARKALNSCKWVKIYGNAEYIVFSPVHKKDVHSFAINYALPEGATVSCIGLERFRLDGKAYKLYKTEKGFALKLNDPISNKKE